MAKRKYSSADMVKNSKSSMAEMPQEVISKDWPKTNSYFGADLDDTITGIDRQMNEDGSRMKKGMNPTKY